MAQAGRQVVAALASRGADGAMATGVQRLASHAGIDTIAARRRVADAVTTAGKYPF